MANKYPTLKLDNTMFKCSYNNGKRVFVTNFPHELEKVMTKLGSFEMACTDDRVIPGADPGQRAPVRPHASCSDAIFLKGLRTVVLRHACTVRVLFPVKCRR